MPPEDHSSLSRYAADPSPSPSVAWHVGDVREIAAETLVVPVPLVGDAGPVLGELLTALGVGTLAEIPGVRELDPSHGSTWRMPALGRIAAEELLFVWYGDEPDVRDTFYEAAMAAGRLAASRTPVALAVDGHERVDGAARLLVEGFLYGRNHPELAPPARGADAAAGELLVVGRGEEPAGFAEQAQRSAVVAGVLGRVRDLVNAPPNALTPVSFAEIAREVGTAAGVEARVWSVEDLRDGGFAGLLEVGRASVFPPALVELSYRGAGPDAPTLALVGKGITFDSGTYDIKPIGEMATMKRDMGGAGAVLGALEAAARLALPVNLVGLLAIAENVLAGDALRPGDVITHRNGVTTEVTNPDAEGRLVLADAIVYAAELRPAAIVEVSTLVGPPLGSDLWGLVASDDGLAEEVLAAGRQACDRGWRLPLWRRYRRHITTPMADQRNSTKSLDYPIAVISSALFLDRFVPAGIPWAHLDVAVTALREGGTATSAWEAGATGSPLRALVEWLDRRGAHDGAA